MELISFSVRNFRSITDAHKINFKNYTVLIGKNNEGKSNLLKALSICMNLVKSPSRARMTMRRRYSYRFREDYYDWERDFPIIYQNRNRGLKTIFKLEFLLTDEELEEFKQCTKTRINSNNINMIIEIGKDNEVVIKFPKKGTNSLTNKSEKVMNFISSKISYNYIPAMRRENDAMNIIEKSLDYELKEIEEMEEYKKAISIMKEVQKSKFEDISKNVKEVLKEFIPNIKSVLIDSEQEYGFESVSFNRNIRMKIDDGTLTDIEYKGDGIKSLVSLAMLKNRNNDNSISVIAIDEPEAHLHPGAMNELAKTLKKLSEKNQIIVSTHNPLFMNKENIKNNIIVNQGKANPAKNIHEIRELLGVKMSDNLINAQYILLVEGESDKIILNTIFSKTSDKLKKYINDGLLSIYSVGGVGNIGYCLRTLSSQFCNCYIFVDNDNAGQDALEKLIEGGEIDRKNTNLCICQGMAESEIEDCFKSDVYINKILEKYGINLKVTEFRNSKKWSERMKNTFNSQGQAWSNKLEKEVKTIVANEISEGFSENIFLEQKASSVKALVQKLEENVKI